MEAIELIHASTSYVFEHKDELVRNGFGFMMRQDHVPGYKLGISLAKLQYVLDPTVLAAIEMVSDNQTIVDNAGTNADGKPMALISFPAGLGLNEICMIHSFMFSMQNEAWSSGNKNDFYTILVA